MRTVRRYYNRQGGYVLPSVCLSVCLLATFHVKTTYWYSTDFIRDVSLNFRSHPYLDPDVRFFGDYSTLQDTAFFNNLAHISGESDRIFIKILVEMRLLTTKNPLNSGCRQDTDSGSGLTSPWRRSGSSDCSCSIMSQVLWSHQHLITTLCILVLQLLISASVQLWNIILVICYV